MAGTTMGASHPDSTLPRSLEAFAKFADIPAGRVLAILVLASAIILSVVVHFSVAVLPYDDAFITFRYVDNALDGRGLVYNEGHRVCGFSTVVYPFWLMLLKTLFRGVGMPTLAVRGNCVPYAAAGLAAFFLVRRITGNRIVAAVAAASLLLHPAMLAVSVGGMEAFLFTALLLFACVALAAGRSALFGLLAALAALTRPEAVVLLPVAVAACWGRRRKLGAALAAFAPLPAAWAAFAFFYYGSIVPLSVLAKMKPLYPLSPGDAAGRLAGALGEAFAGAALEPFPLLRPILALVLVALTSASCLMHRPSRWSFAWTCPLVFWTFLAMYLWGNPLVFQWYWPAVFVSALLTVLVGMPAAASLAGTWLERRGRGALATGVVAGVLVVTLAWLAAVTALCATRTRVNLNMSVLQVGEDAGYLRIVGYRKAAEMLGGVIRPGERVAAPEVGSLGYYLRAYLIDACGLVSPEALPYLPVPEGERLGPVNGAISVELVQGTQPEWVVTMPTFAVRSLFVSDWFRRNYGLWGRAPLPKPCWGSDAIYIFRKLPDAR